MPPASTLTRPRFRRHVAAPLALLATLALGLAGCGGGSKAATSEPGPSQAAPTGGSALSPSLSSREAQAKQQADEESAAAAEEKAREEKEAAEAGR